MKLICGEHSNWRKKERDGYPRILLVGAVIVKDEEIIGEGYHERYGQLHAERNALAHCTKSPKGATIYVTLEPCCHHGKTAAVYRCPACRRNPQGGDWIEGSKPSGTWKRHPDFEGAWCGSDPNMYWKRNVSGK